MNKAQAFIRRNRIQIAIAFCLLVLAFARPSQTTILYGLIAVVLGEGVRIWAAGHLRKALVPRDGRPEWIVQGQEGRPLTTSGPYAYTRNPLYLGNFLIGLGLSIGTGRWFIVAIFLVFFLLVYREAVLQEEEYLRSRFGDAYQEYACRVPRFLPRLRPDSNQSQARFSWRQVMRNDEYQAWAAIVLVLIVLEVLAFYFPYGLLASIF